MVGDNGSGIGMSQVVDGFVNGRDEVMAGIDTGKCVDYLAIWIAQIHHRVSTDRTRYLLTVTKINLNFRDRSNHLPGRDDILRDQLLEFCVFEKSRPQSAGICTGHCLIKVAEHAKKQDRLVRALRFNKRVGHGGIPADPVNHSPLCMAICECQAKTCHQTQANPDAESKSQFHDRLTWRQPTCYVEASVGAS